jgi:hypothetical protein
LVRSLDYGFRPVRLPNHPDVPLSLVVVRGLGEQPTMLLTNLPLRRHRDVLWWVVAAYLNHRDCTRSVRCLQ